MHFPNRRLDALNGIACRSESRPRRPPAFAQAAAEPFAQARSGHAPERKNRRRAAVR